MIRLMLDDQYSTMPWEQLDAVVFDVGNVLLRWDPLSLLERFVPEVPDLHPLLHRVIFLSPYWTMMDRGSITQEEAITGMTAGHPELEPFIRRIMGCWADLSAIPEGVNALKACKAHDKKLYVLSNYPREGFRQALNTHDFFRLFDGQFVSSHHQLVKPDPVIYQRVAEVFSLTPERTLFIDDSPINIEAALHAGWQGLCFNVPGKLAAFIGCDFQKNA